MLYINRRDGGRLAHGEIHQRLEISAEYRGYFC
jgi:hypothetical protein